MKKCPKCGSVFEDACLCCTVCGTPLEQASALKGRMGGKTLGGAPAETGAPEGVSPAPIPEKNITSGRLKGKVGNTEFRTEPEPLVTPLPAPVPQPEPTPLPGKNISSGRLKGKVGNTEFHTETDTHTASSDFKPHDVKAEDKSGFVTPPVSVEPASSGDTGYTSTPISTSSEKKLFDRKWIAIVAGIAAALVLTILTVVIISSIHKEKNNAGYEPTRAASNEPTKREDDQPGPSVKYQNYYEPVAEKQIQEEEGVHYVSGQFVVVSAAGVPYDEMKKLFSSYELQIVGYIELMNTYQVRNSKKMTLSDMEQMADKLTKEKLVEAAVLDVVWETEASGLPNDSWGEPDGKPDWSSNDGNNWGVKAINAPYCWEHYDLGKVKVGIIDTVFDPDHEDLRAQYALIKYNESYSQPSPNSHGTHVAGIIGATHNNNSGLAGVLEDASIYAVSKYGLTSFVETLSAIADLLEDGVKVINYSIGYPEEVVLKAEKGDKETRALYYFQTGEYVRVVFSELQNKGYEFLLVQAAGNNGIDARWGSAFAYSEKEEVKNHVIVVGSVRNSNGYYYLASSSNKGKRVDVTAPGVSIYSTIFNNEYASYSGTSMAAPFVTGICASVWAASPNLTSAQVKKIITSTANIPVSGNCPKMVNMKAAMAEVLAPAEQPSDSSSTPTTTTAPTPPPIETTTTAPPTPEETTTARPTPEPTTTTVPPTPAPVLSDGQYYGQITSYDGRTITFRMLSYFKYSVDAGNVIWDYTGEVKTLDYTRASVRLEEVYGYQLSDSWRGGEVPCSSLNDAFQKMDSAGGSSPFVYFVVRNGVITDIVFKYVA